MSNHLAPAACYVCGQEDHAPTPYHRYVSNAQADAELAAQPVTRHVFPDGTTDPAAHYVATHRPY